MSQYLKRASELQRQVKIDEQQHQVPYTVEDARQASIHARQDVVMICSFLLDLNKQMAWVRYSTLFVAVSHLLILYTLFIDG